MTCTLVLFVRILPTIFRFLADVLRRTLTPQSMIVEGVYGQCVTITE